LTKDQQRINYAQQQLAAQLKLRPVNWAEAHFIADSPNKIRGEAKEQELIYNQFSTLMGQPKERMELVSAYFVPTQQGTDFLTGLAGKNVEVRVLTNSFLANDVAVVHAFYQKYRKDLLENGVKLYEFKPYIERSKRTWYEVMTEISSLRKAKMPLVCMQNFSILTVWCLLDHLTLIHVPQI
jgi:Phosphatidylserine/phosphatidylglycerophosphate/cardiolipin synthases and related enzymes